MTYVLDEQRVACDPLHGLEQEAGERHALAAVVGGDLLLGGVGGTIISNHSTKGNAGSRGVSASAPPTLRKSLKSGWM